MPSRRLRALLDDLAARPDIGHAVLAVESGDRSFHWADATGLATPDGSPMTQDTPFFIASIDKLFTATVILQLHESGHVRLDEPIGAHLPSHDLEGLHRLGAVDRTNRLTVRHLLAHASGLPDHLEDSPKGGRSIVERLVSDGDFPWTTADALRHVRDNLTPHFQPQALGGRPRIRYSDTNYVLLMAAIEEATGRPVHEAFVERIFKPLSLRRTFVLGETRPAEGTLAPAALWAGTAAFERPLALRALTSLYSTAGELIQFMRALVAGELFADRATAALMRGQWHRFGFPFDRAALRSPNWPIEYGLGMMRFKLPRFLTLLRSVPAVIGHTGSTGSWLFYAPEVDVYVAGTVDQLTAGAVPYRLVPKVLRALQDCG